jgi:hypothetical protein
LYIIKNNPKHFLHTEIHPSGTLLAFLFKKNSNYLVIKNYALRHTVV